MRPTTCLQSASRKATKVMTLRGTKTCYREAWLVAPFLMQLPGHQHVKHFEPSSKTRNMLPLDMML